MKVQKLLITCLIFLFSFTCYAQDLVKFSCKQHEGSTVYLGQKGKIQKNAFTFRGIEFLFTYDLMELDKKGPSTATVQWLNVNQRTEKPMLVNYSTVEKWLTFINPMPAVTRMYTIFLGNPTLTISEHQTFIIGGVLPGKLSGEARSLVAKCKKM